MKFCAVYCIIPDCDQMCDSMINIIVEIIRDGLSS